MDYAETNYEIFQPDGKTKLASHIWLPKGKPRAILVAVHGGMAFAGDWVNTAIAGEDRLADPDGSEKALKSVTLKPVEMVKYPQNYHENFNEVNRKEICDVCMKWIEKLIKI